MQRLVNITANILALTQLLPFTLPMPLDRTLPPALTPTPTLLPDPKVNARQKERIETQQAEHQRAALRLRELESAYVAVSQDANSTSPPPAHPLTPERHMAHARSHPT